jgi:hypothetical protein
MAKLEFKLPIAAAKFPFDYAKASRAVLRPELDVVSRAPVSFAGGNESMDHNVIQLLHCENMMPVDTGMRAVGFWRSRTSIGSTSGMKQLFPLQRDYYLADGISRVTAPGLSWGTTTGAAALTSTTAVAVVSGTRCFVINPTGSSFFELGSPATPGLVTARTLTMPAGFAAGQINSICGSGNYLIALHRDTAAQVTVLWSSITDPTNLADTASGAGRAIPNSDIGIIHTVRQTLDGFFLFGTTGMIAAVATNDATRPFAFRPISGSAGTIDRYDIPYSRATSEQYVKTLAGIQRVTPQRAEYVMPDAVDFLQQSSYSFWQGQMAQSNKNVVYQLNYLAGRYVVLSYDSASVFYPTTQFARALVFDTQLSRWGKIDVMHSTVIAERSIVGNQYGELTKLSFIKLDGTTDIAVWDADMSWTGSPGGSVQPNGIAVIGHIKGTRGKAITFSEAIIDGCLNGLVYLLPAVVGHNRPSTITLTFVGSDGSRATTWRGRHTSNNFDLAMVGQLDLTTIIVSATQHGSR